MDLNLLHIRWLWLNAEMPVHRVGTRCYHQILLSVLLTFLRDLLRNSYITLGLQNGIC